MKNINAAGYLLPVFLLFIFLIPADDTQCLKIKEQEVQVQKKRYFTLLRDNNMPRPDEWGWVQRTFPYFNSDPGVYIEALAIVSRLKETQKREYLDKGKNIAHWEFAGPINIGGRVVDIEFNPVNPDIVYAGSSTGGIFKSSDKGVSWFPIFDDQSVLTIGDLAIDPVNPEIIYAGTGEANGGHNNFPGGGVFKSTDAGETWRFLGLENTISTGRIVINPVNPRIIYLAAVGSYFSPNPERGILKSTNGGESWEKSLFVSDSTGAIDLIMDSSNPSFLMAAMWERVRRPNDSHLSGPSGGIYRTTNGGASWQLLNSSNGLPGGDIGRIGLAQSPSSPNIIYAIFNDGSFYLNLYKTTDYGDTWIIADTDSEISSGTSNFSWYFGQVRVHPLNPDIVYVLDVSFMRSSDGGLTWPVIYGYGSDYPQLHVDHHALAFHPFDPDYIISGNDGGINISTDAGLSWSGPALLPNTQFYEIGLDYNNPQKLYGGTQDNNTIRTNSGKISDWERIWGGDGMYVNIDFQNPEIIYAESQYGLLVKSTDGGLNFSPAMEGINPEEPVNWSTPVVMDPHNNKVLYYGTDRIYRTTDGALSWTPVSSDLTDGLTDTRLGTVTTIAVAPSDSNIIYAGTDDSHVWVSTDYGKSWRDISADSDLPRRWVTRVVPDPADAAVVYVTFSGLKWKDSQPHVFGSSNFGSTWTDISSNLPDAPVNAFAVDPNDGNTLYIGSDVGAFVTFNRGAKWEIMGQGLPTVPVYDMKIHPVENYLAAGTHGRSMYKLDLNQFTDRAAENDFIAENFKLHQNYPNPFNPSTRISFEIIETSLVTLKIYDLPGKEVLTLLNEIKPPGRYTVDFNTSMTGNALSSGIYFYKLQAGRYTGTRKMLFLK